MSLLSTVEGDFFKMLPVFEICRQDWIFLGAKSQQKHMYAGLADYMEDIDTASSVLFEMSNKQESS